MERQITRAFVLMVGLAWSILSCNGIVSPAVASPVFQINNRGPAAQPAVAQLKDGGVVVVWRASAAVTPGGIRGQRFQADGVEVGREFQVARAGRFAPSVAGLADGGFVVVSVEGLDGDIRGQRFAADGTKVGRAFRVNTNLDSQQLWPRVVGLNGGGFVVVWMRGPNSTNYEIMGRLFAANGKPVGKEFMVNTDTLGQQLNPAVAALNGQAGGFVVLWEHLEGIEYSVRGQRFSAEGNQLGGEFQFGARGSNGTEPRTAALTNGGFVVVWVGRYSQGNDHLYGRRFSASGAVDGRRFTIDKSAFRPDLPDIAALTRNRFVVAWLVVAHDPEIYGQRYAADATKDKRKFPVSKATARPGVALAAASDRFIAVWQAFDNDQGQTVIRGRWFSFEP